MAKNLVYQEARQVPMTAPYALTSGQGALVGATFGVAQSDAANGTEVVLDIEGAYTLPKLSTDVVAQGVLIYWDNTNRRCTVTASGNTKIGVALEAAGNGVANVLVRLNGAF